MSEPCTIVVGARQLHDALRRFTGVIGEVLTFSDSEPLEAFNAIVSRRPHVVAFERLFAATSRGAALINRIKMDPALARVEVRIVAHDGTYARVSPRRTPPARSAAAGATETAVAVDTLAPPAASLDYRGTRRAIRFRMADATATHVDGMLSELIDLSTEGAQILSPAALKPGQIIRMALTDERGVVRLGGSVVWVSFEIPGGVSRYRAGVEFKDADAKTVDAFCKRHETSSKQHVSIWR